MSNQYLYIPAGVGLEELALTIDHFGVNSENAAIGNNENITFLRVENNETNRQLVSELADEANDDEYKKCLKIPYNIEFSYDWDRDDIYERSLIEHDENYEDDENDD